MVVLIRVQVNPDVNEVKDCITLGDEVYNTLEEAQGKMIAEVEKCIEETNARLNGEYPDEDDPIWMVESVDYQIQEMGAWVAYPDPMKWKILKIS